MTPRAAARFRARRHAPNTPDDAPRGRHRGPQTRWARTRSIPVMFAMLAAVVPAMGAASGADGGTPATTDAPRGATALTVTDPGPQAQALLDARAAGASSRSQERVAVIATTPDAEVAPLTAVPAPPPDPYPPYPGCDGVVSQAGTNGRVPDSELCTLWMGSFRARADAAVRLQALNVAYQKAFGEPLCLVSGYRTYGDQVAVKRHRGRFAATPGTSNHGWGLAVDFCGSAYAGDRWDWLKAHGPDFGFDNPPWARRGGDGPYEPWHWEYTEAVAAIE